MADTSTATPATATPETRPAPVEVEVEHWVDTRDAAEWAPSYSEDYKRGYDDAVYEVASMLGLRGPCAYKPPYGKRCGRDKDDRTVHVQPHERMRPGAHLWRLSR